MAKPNDKNPRQETVKLKATSAHPYHKEGVVFEIHPVHKERLLNNKWAVGEGEKTTAVKDGAEPLSHGEANGEGNPNA